MPQPSPFHIRPFRPHDQDDTSEPQPEHVPFLSQADRFVDAPELEDGEGANGQPPHAASPDTAVKYPAVSCADLPAPTSTFDGIASQPCARWEGPERLRWLRHWWHRRSPQAHRDHGADCCRHRTRRASPLRKILRLLGFCLMLLGGLEFIALACGLLTAFFPDDVEDDLDSWRSSAPSSPDDDLTHWPTDASADIHPVACHSHNDYWRKQPLFSALAAGCTSVEADVWLVEQDLHVGHSTASLTARRTLRSLYVDPLVKILEQQNPITPLHPAPSRPRNGVFDTQPSQSLVLLIDFKNDGDDIWPYVDAQLAPLRDRKYLTYFNGTGIVDGPIVVVVTGNAPFHRVVANTTYRDIFFDAPLDLMDKVSEFPPTADQSLGEVTDAGTGTGLHGRDNDNQGQGYSGNAPKTPAVYAPANSYFASVSFKSSIGWPWRGRLSRRQLDKMRKQIAGAHARGLKVRYWGVPSWPRGMRNYLWRTLVKEGIDYLNVDDLRAATKGDWNWDKKGFWLSGPWQFWTSAKST